MKAERTVQGVRYRLAATRPSRYTAGCTHIEYYDKVNRLWRFSCQPDAWWNVSHDFINWPACCADCAPLIEKVFPMLAA